MEKTKDFKESLKKNRRLIMGIIFVSFVLFTRGIITLIALIYGLLNLYWYLSKKEPKYKWL